MLLLMLLLPISISGISSPGLEIISTIFLLFNSISGSLISSSLLFLVSSFFPFNNSKLFISSPLLFKLGSLIFTSKFPFSFSFSFLLFLLLSRSDKLNISSLIDSSCIF